MQWKLFFVFIFLSFVTDYAKGAPICTVLAEKFKCGSYSARAVLQGIPTGAHFGIVFLINILYIFNFGILTSCPCFIFQHTDYKFSPNLLLFSSVFLSETGNKIV